MFTSDGLCRPEFERISTPFDGCFISRVAIPGGSFLCFGAAVEAGSAKALPVGTAGKIVRNAGGMLLFSCANRDTLTDVVDLSSAD